MAKGGSDLVKFMTQQFVEYMETPREVRKQARSEAKANKEPWLTHWFGWGPMGLKLWWKGKSGRGE